MSMTLRSVKSLFAFVVVLGAGLALAGAPATTVAPAATAAPLVLDWRVIGTGTGTNACPTTAGVTSCTFSGNATGDHVGSSTYSVTVTEGPILLESNGSGGPNAAQGECAISSGSANNMVIAADGSKIFFNTVGLLCNEGPMGTPPHYNGTYRITGGTGRFSAASGGGSLVATLAPTASGVEVSFIKIDGTINF